MTTTTPAGPRPTGQHRDASIERADGSRRCPVGCPVGYQTANPSVTGRQRQRHAVAGQQRRREPMLGRKADPKHGSSSHRPDEARVVRVPTPRASAEHRLAWQAHALHAQQRCLRDPASASQPRAAISGHGAEHMLLHAKCFHLAKGLHFYGKAGRKGVSDRCRGALQHVGCWIIEGNGPWWWRQRPGARGSQAKGGRKDEGSTAPRKRFRGAVDWAWGAGRKRAWSPTVWAIKPSGPDEATVHSWRAEGKGSA